MIRPHAMALVAITLAGCAAAARGPSGSASASASASAEASIPISSPAEYADRPISKEAGADYFLHTGSGDPYVTGVAYPIFLALMDLFPNALGRDWGEVEAKFGFLADPAAKGDARAIPIGFHLTRDPITGVDWLVANCQMCHADRLRLDGGDVIVAGLGNKRVRAHAYGSALARIGGDARLVESEVLARATKHAAEWGAPWPEEMRAPIVRATIEGMRAFAAKRASRLARFEDGLPGRAATIESFAIALEDQTGARVPMPDAIGWTKIPDVVGVPVRDTFSYDASAYGAPSALVLEADFLFGTRPAWYATHPHIATSMLLYLKSFARKLPFPRPIDRALAERGRAIFDAKCASCHGVYVSYDGETRVSYREQVIPLEMVGTDATRASAVTPAFVEAANGLELTRGLTRARSTGGYVPPVLLDVWARGLYGHAGQWPSLEVLATMPDARPKRFIVDLDGRYDLDRIGVRYAITKSARPTKPSEYVYDANVPGYGVGGHPFLAELPKDDARAVIELLKTL